MLFVPVTAINVARFVEAASGSLNVTATVVAGCGWIASVAGTIAATRGGVRSTVWNLDENELSGWRPKISAVAVLTSTVSCLESGHVPLSVTLFASADNVADAPIVFVPSRTE